MRPSLLLLLAGVTGCTSDAPADRAGSPAPPDSLSSDSLTGTFEGHYSAGFEHTGFVPCADPAEAWWTEPATTETAIAPDQARLEMRPAADINARYTETVGSAEGLHGHGVTVWVRLRGRTTPRADAAAGQGYGHEGAYTREFAVDSVEAVVRDTAVAACPPPASVRP